MSEPPQSRLRCRIKRRSSSSVLAEKTIDFGEDLVGDSDVVGEEEEPPPAKVQSNEAEFYLSFDFRAHEGEKRDHAD